MKTFDRMANTATADKIREWAKAFNVPSFIAEDPVQFPRKYMGSIADAEISGVLTALLSFGNRKSIIKAATRLDGLFRGNPRKWLMSLQFLKDIPDNEKSFYRTIPNNTMRKWCRQLYYVYSVHYSLECYVWFWCKEDESMTPIRVLQDLFGFSRTSASKRLCMFLRWMVRNDGIVNIGRWSDFRPSELIMPLDTHVIATAKELGILPHGGATMKTAIKLTNYFRGIFPDDPLLGDFALFGYGVNNNKH